MTKRFKASQPQRSFDHDGTPSKIKRSHPRSDTLHRRRRRFGVLVVLLLSLVSAIYALNYVSEGRWNLSDLSEGALWPFQEAEPEQVPEQADT